jgi:subtilisin family serine protease
MNKKLLGFGLMAIGFVFITTVTFGAVLLKDDGQSPQYAAGKLIVKFKPVLGAQAGTLFKKGQAFKAIIGTGTLDLLNQKHKIKKMERMFKDLASTSAAAKAKTSKARFAQRAKRAPLSAQSPDLENIYVLETDDPLAYIPAIAEAYKKDPNVVYAEPDYKVKALMFPNDPYYASSNSWGQGYDDLWDMKKISCLSAWDIAQGEGVIVAVIDTGVDYTHPDIAANMWNDGADHYGYDFVNNDVDPMDGYGHGTHCAGTIAAIGNNNLGIIGVAPKAKIMAVKGLDDYGSGYVSVLALCLRYAADNGADVLSNSWGVPGFSQTIADAVDYAHDLGCVIVAAAGNNNADAINFSPANLSNVITVSALDQNDQKCYFSNYGQKIDVGAPGGNGNFLLSDGTRAEYNVLSLLAPNSYFATNLSAYIVGTNYLRIAGTSMACPHVAGLAALILSHDPTFTNEEVRQVIRVSADDVGPTGQDIDSGYGRINAYTAVQINSVCTALISNPAIDTPVEGTLEIKGQASGQNFLNYTLDYGPGNAPGSWTVLETSSTPVLSGTLGTWQTDTAADGDYTLRLRVVDTSNRIFECRQILSIQNAIITSPIAGEPCIGGAKITIMGSADGSSLINYKLEYGDTTSPSQWLTTGITLANNGNAPVAKGILGELNTGLMTPSPISSMYTLRLTAHYSGGIPDKTYLVTFFIDFDLKPGWPVMTMTNYYHAMATADLNNDGKKELLKGEFSPYALRPLLHALEPDGTELSGWPFELPYGYYNLMTPAVADLDNDGQPEIVIAGTAANSSTADSIWVLKKDGSIANGWPVKLSYPGFEYNLGRLALADIDNDGHKEIITSFGANTIAAFHDDGTLVNGWPITVQSYFSSSPAIGDLDGDKEPEIVMLVVPANGELAKVYAWHADGTLVSGWPKSMTYPNSRYLDFPPVLADLNADGKLEIIAHDDKSVYVWDANGNLLPGWPWSDPTGDMWVFGGNFAVGDVNNDGKLEIAFGCSRYFWSEVGNINLFLLKPDGTAMPNWPVTTDYVHMQTPIIGDIDGDGAQEVICGSMDSPYATGDSRNGRVWAFKVNGQPVNRFPKKCSGDVLSPVIIDDIDNDAKADLIATSHYWPMDGGNIEGNTYVWSFNTHYASAEWPMFQHDLCRTGNYAYGKIGDSTPPTTPVVTDDGATTTSTTTLHASWTSSDPESGITEYQYAIGTSPGATDTVAWTSTGTTPNVTKTGLSLVNGTIYYFSVKAKNGAGLWSAAGYSDGIKVVADDVPQILNGQTITGLSGAKSSWRYYKIYVPAGKRRLIIRTWGGSGDADLYFRYGSKPTRSLYDRRSVRINTNTETCTWSNPAAGYYYIGIYGHKQYSKASLKACY